jgi:hypothetical protein
VTASPTAHTRRRDDDWFFTLATQARRRSSGHPARVCSAVGTAHSSTPHAPAARAALAVALSIAVALLCAPSALAISRDTALSRAQGWADNSVKYSQSKYHNGYRTDCSGYVSMCWATRTSWSTSTFHAVTHRIKVSQLKPGDAILKRGYHIRLFYGWADAERTTYIAYESGYGRVAVVRPHSIASDLHDGYVPVRYNRISDSPASTNVLRNRSFDTWPKAWSAGAEEPAWWSVSGPEHSAPATRRKDVYRTARNSLCLTNLSNDPHASAEMSQTIAVAPGFYYALQAWARTPSDPRALGLRVTYFDATGVALAETSTAGSAWGLSNSAFRRMYSHLLAPPGAAKAQVVVSLAGGTTTDTATGSARAGTSAILDDITLSRTRVAVGIAASAKSLRRGGSVVLSGSIAPTSAVGLSASVYVSPPGRSWRRCGRVTITSTAAGGAQWRFKYKTAKRGRAGIYRFRVVAPAVPGYLGNTSRVVSVRAR